MKILITLLMLCMALNTNAATYMLLSQTNAFAAGITNAAKAYADTKAPLASPALTGTPTINGQSVETQLTNKIDNTLTTLQSMSGPLAVPSLIIGSMSIGMRSVLTEVGGNVVCDLSLTNRYWSCSPTGNVQVLITNASAGNWGNLLLRWPATNCMFTHGSLPAGSITNWISGAPSTNATAGTIGFLGIYPIDSTTNSTICGYSATQ